MNNKKRTNLKLVLFLCNCPYNVQYIKNELVNISDKDKEKYVSNLISNEVYYWYGFAKRAEDNYIENKNLQLSNEPMEKSLIVKKENIFKRFFNKIIGFVFRK